MSWFRHADVTAVRRRRALVDQATIPAIRAMRATTPIATHTQGDTELDVPPVAVGDGVGVAAAVVAAAVVAAAEVGTAAEVAG
jgi:hypothetical protein